jgi:hypothetical protein
MRLLGRFIRSSASDRRLFLNAAALSLIIRIGLAACPLHTLKRVCCRRTHSVAPEAAPRLDALTLAVSRASRFLPGLTCLGDALVLKTLLDRAGYRSALHVGVTRSDESPLEAHAWLEAQGKALIGGDNLERYTRLLVLERSL